jgi:hypothetical protein
MQRQLESLTKKGAKHQSKLLDSARKIRRIEVLFIRLRRNVKSVRREPRGCTDNLKTLEVVRSSNQVNQRKIDRFEPPAGKEAPPNRAISGLVRLD